MKWLGECLNCGATFTCESFVEYWKRAWRHTSFYIHQKEVHVVWIKEIKKGNRSENP